MEAIVFLIGATLVLIGLLATIGNWIVLAALFLKRSPSFVPPIGIATIPIGAWMCGWMHWWPWVVAASLLDGYIVLNCAGYVLWALKRLGALRG